MLACLFVEIWSCVAQDGPELNVCGKEDDFAPTSSVLGLQMCSVMLGLMWNWGLKPGLYEG